MSRVEPEQEPLDTVRRYPRTASEAFKDAAYTNPLDGWPSETPTPFERFEDALDYLDKNVGRWLAYMIVGALALAGIVRWWLK